MECPRCGGEVAEYALDGREAIVCESCGYVGVPADHRGEPADEESWSEAIGRFRDERRRERREREAETIRVGDRELRVPRAVRRRFESLTPKQRAIVAELIREPDPADPDRTYATIGEAAGAHESYVGEVVRTHGDLLDALVAAGDGDGETSPDGAPG